MAWVSLGASKAVRVAMTTAPSEGVSSAVANGPLTPSGSAGALVEAVAGRITRQQSLPGA